jgi:UDP-N-acetylmuramate--alanine ligase
MSGVALLLLEKGCVVSGSDAVDSTTLRELESAGVTVYRGHDECHGLDAQVVLWSPAISDDNVELVSAKRRGARLISRGELLGELAASTRVIGLTGTHGKTTATSMMVHVARAAGRDDARLLGAPVLGVGANGHYAPGDLILEVDESYGSFARLSPFSLGLLNVEADHLDHYGTLENLEAAFEALIERTSGPVVVFDEPGTRRVLSRGHAQVALVSFEQDSPWRVRDVRLERRGASFTLDGPDGHLDVALAVTGRHNVTNAATVAVLARSLGIASEHVSEGLIQFRGAPRRFEHLGSWRGVEVIQDYAHLPGEVRATIAACVGVRYERIGVVFQPHRYTRTEKLASAFANAFDGCSLLVVTDIYGAGEMNHSDITGEVVADAVRATKPTFEVDYAATFADVVEVLNVAGERLDVLLLVGAGDVVALVDMLPGGLRE